MPCSYNPGTFQGVPLDSLGIVAVKIGRNYAPDRRQHRQEAPKRIPATPAAFLRFLVHFLRRGGVWDRLYSSQTLPSGWGTLKDKDTHGWFLTTRCIYPFPWSYSPETSQGVLLDSLGVGAVEIGRIIAPDPSPTSPTSAEALFGNAGGVFAFFRRPPAAWGGWKSPVFVPCTALSLGGLKGQETRGWSQTTRVFWHFLCLWRERGCVVA